MTMQISLHIAIYVTSLGALALLAWLNPRRLRIAQLTTRLAPITGWLRLLLIGLVVLPIGYAIWRGHWAELCIVTGLLMGWGWWLALLLAVQREEREVNEG